MTDDDTATLTVTIAAASISEHGGTTEGTVHRNTGTSGALEVSLFSSDTGEAGVPTSVTIPDGADSATFTITGADDALVDGTQTVTITGSATGFTAGDDTLDVTDDEAMNSPPSDIALDNTSVAENLAGALIGNVIVTDPNDGDTHTVAVSDPRFDIAGGELKLKAGVALDHEKEPTVSLYITAVDLVGLWITESFVITVTDVNEPPVMILVINENAEGEMIGDLSVDDPDTGDTHVFTVSDSRFEVDRGRLRLKAGMSLDYEQESEVTVDVTATDDGDLSFTQSIVIAVNDLNERPELTNAIPEQQTEENQTFSFVVASDTFRDVDAGDSLEFTATQDDGTALPEWLSFHGPTRSFTGTPRLGESGNVSVVLKATDTGGLYVPAPFTITVAPDPNPWQNPGPNPADPMDVDDNGNTAPLDVLTVINFINRNGAGPLPTPASPSSVEGLYVDINGDDNCTPLDVLELINYINRQVHAGGEGESESSDVESPHPGKTSPSGRLLSLQLPVVTQSMIGANAPSQVTQPDDEGVSSQIQDGVQSTQSHTEATNISRSTASTLASPDTLSDDDPLSDFEHLLDIIARDTATNSPLD